MLNDDYELLRIHNLPAWSDMVEARSASGEQTQLAPVAEEPEDVKESESAEESDAEERALSCLEQSKLSAISQFVQGALNRMPPELWPIDTDAGYFFREAPENTNAKLAIKLNPETWSVRDDDTFRDFLLSYHFGVKWYIGRELDVLMLVYGSEQELIAPVLDGMDMWRPCNARSSELARVWMSSDLSADSVMHPV